VGTHKLPLAIVRGRDDLRIGGDRRAVDRERTGHLELVEDYDEAPEPDTRDDETSPITAGLSF
jgi:hypothetical protein